MQDNKSNYLQNQSINNINRVRKDRAIANRNNDLQYAMSRSPEFYQDPKKRASVKGILASTPAMTTDQNESRNMYQMLMNQMKGGDKGARLIDTRGLPAGARRTGRNLFTNPAKSQGFFGDVGSLFTGKNKAAVRAPEYNPFPEAGFGEEYYKDKFGGFDFGGLMEGIMKIATPLKYLPKGDPRAPLERDSSFLPRNNPFDIEFDEMENIPFEGVEEDIYSMNDFALNRAREDGRAGKFPYSPNDFSSDVGGENGNFLMEEGYTDIAAQNDINKLEGIIAGKYAEDNLPFDQKIGLPEGELNNDDKLALEAVLRSEEYQNAAKNLDYYKMKEMLDPYMDTDDMTSLLYGSN